MQWLLGAALRVAVALQDDIPTVPSLRVSLANAVVHVDGRLDEAAWQSADSIPDLFQVEPVERATPSGRTVVRVLVSADALIVGVRAEYAPGTPIVAFARERDANLESEDHIGFVLDTFRDGRSGYVFVINANGARYDALVSRQGEDENSNWDTAWEAATTRIAGGWSAEIRIPIKSLLFKPGLTSWGFNIQRRIQWRQETARWASPSKDIEAIQTSRAGLLTDLPTFNIGAGTSLRPAITTGGGRADPAARFTERTRASLDATQRMGTNTLGSLTVNTDFAETEVDTRRVNLTRFPLFFPEKRTFFLEGADIFEFGAGLDEDVIPFFSRRIGLIAGEQVPINAGGKINGRLGGMSFGALGVNTRDVDTLSSAATMGAVRVTRNLLGESSVGMIGTVGDPIGRGDAWLIGPDLTLRTSHFRGNKNFLVGVWGLATGREGLTGDRTASGFKIDYPNDLWDIAVKYKRIGNGFDPSLGFVPRPNVHIAQASVDWQPRPTRPIGPLHIRQCFWENELEYVAGLSGPWESYRYFMAPINCRLESGDRFEFNVVPTGEQFTEAFEVADGVTIAPGAYHFRRYRLEAGFAAKRRLSAQATWWFGSFYDGYLNQYILTSAWKPTSLFIMEWSGERNVGLMPSGRFTQNVASTRFRLNVSPDLQVTSLVQYDDESHSFGSNTRLRWTFDPLGDVFLVYNHNMRTRDPLTFARQVAFESNQLLLKLQYAFRY